MSYASIYSESILTPPAAENKVSRRRSLKNRSSSIPLRAAGAEQADGDSQRHPIIVHSHLCWDWVWQRPQQFISRLSKQHRVLFVETVAPDPALVGPLVRFRNLPQFPNLTILTMQFPAWYWNHGKRVDRERRALVRQFLQGPGGGQFDHPIQWFYDPMAVPAFLGQMDEVLTVYDCMDELSKFACAPAEIVERELLLLERADVVFTGGRRLFESKRLLNGNCHFYGCGVESEHFAKAMSPDAAVPPELARLPKPVLGYFGVVDERLDYTLLAQLAEANPRWSIAIIGPVLKVDDRALPKRKNLHWLGKRDYQELPAFCKGMDVCLMPFALNESTEFINPTKALEYMASGRPIVSTAVPDVVTNFGHVVQIARSREEFIDLCVRVSEKLDQPARQRGLEMAAQNSWDAIVARLESHLKEALQKKAALETVA